jgi:hypothetical protein
MQSTYRPIRSPLLIYSWPGSAYPASFAVAKIYFEKIDSTKKSRENRKMVANYSGILLLKISEGKKINYF